MFNRIIYLMLSSAILSVSPMPTNSVVKMNKTESYANYQYPSQTSKTTDYSGSDVIQNISQDAKDDHLVLTTKELLDLFGIVVFYYA